MAAVDIMAEAMEAAMAGMATAAACLQAVFRRHLRLCHAWRARHAALPTRLVRVFANSVVGP